MKHLYLHVPFCNSICFYCDFKRSVYDEKLINEWLKEINKEIIEKLNTSCLKTIYLGGGTPSSLNDNQLELLLNMLKPYANEVSEYTIESNIESLSVSKIEIMKKFKINRISLGVQSLNNQLLKEMNRKHTKEEVFFKIKQIFDLGIKNISIDLIYGFENQSLEVWKQDLYEIVKNPYINHLSLYSLTIEENTIFGKQNKKTCSNDLEALMYDQAISILEEYGFIQYEIANFAKIGYQSIHNTAYWTYEDFYGIGVGASGKESNVRYHNDASIIDYTKGIRGRIDEVLSKEDLMFENIMMSLRLKVGLDINLFNQRYGVDFLCYYKDVIKICIEHNDLQIVDHYIRYTKKGMFYLHDILILFMD